MMWDDMNTDDEVKPTDPTDMPVEEADESEDDETDALSGEAKGPDA